MNSLQKVEDKAKIYEDISTKKDPCYETAIRAIDIIKDYIIKKGLIVYGGTAIDYALRLHGDNIYPDELLALPDLDFYSPDNVGDAYELTDILYSAGYKEVRAISAIHVRTMKVDIINNHFLADISFIEPEIFCDLPYVEYENMKVIHPWFQKMDLHSSLSFPYDDPPNEVIFVRWKKDIERYNKLDKYYPHEPSDEKLNLRKITINLKKYNKFLFNGVIALELLKYCLNSMKKVKDSKSITIENGFMTVTAEKLELATDNTENIDYLKPESVEYYSSYLEVFTKHVECSVDGLEAFISVIDRKLLSYHTLKIKDQIIKIVSPQYMLMTFLAKAQFLDQKAYINYYLEALCVIEEAEKIISKEENKDALILKSPFFPSVETYGKNNISDSYEIGLVRLFKELGKALPEYECRPLNLPVNYYPDAGKEVKKFDYNEKYFIRDGRKLTKEQFVGL